MRIISQDGLREVEYENCGLSVNPKCCEIEAYTSNPNFTPVMASYSSVEKYRKALEILHYAYMIHISFNTMSEYQRVSFLSDITEAGKRYVDGIFQFPADDEIEV